MSTSAGAKTCIKCGADCSGKPRTKDTQGRYTCKTCFDAAAKPKPVAPMASAQATPKAPPKVAPKAPPRPAAPPEPEELDVMSALLKDSPVITEQCPQCGVGMTADSVICTACGYNKETGRGMNVRVQGAVREKRAGGLAVSFQFSPLWTALLMIGLLVGLFIAAMNSPDMALVYAGVLGLFSLITLIAAVIFAFKDGRPGWGVVGLLSWFPFVGLVFLYYVFAVNERGHLKAMWGACIIGGIMNVVLRVQGGDL